MLPQAGGLYVYLRVAYGALPAFLFGWVEFLIVRAGSMATLAAAFARYFAELVPPPAAIRDEVWQAGAAVAGDRGGHRGQRPGHATGRDAPGRRHGPESRRRAGADPLPFLLGAGTVANLTPLWPSTVGRLDLHGYDGRDGQRALGLRRLDQRHAARGRDSRPRPQHPACSDLGHGRLDRRLSVR